MERRASRRPCRRGSLCRASSGRSRMGASRLKWYFFDECFRNTCARCVSPRTLFQPDATMPPPRMESDGFGMIELGIDAQLRAEAGAARAGAVRVVERERARRELFDGDAAVLAGVVLREHEFATFRRTRSTVTRPPRERATRSPSNPSDARRMSGLHYKTVHDDLDAVLFILVQFDGLRKDRRDCRPRARGHNRSCCASSKTLACSPLLAADDRGEHLELRRPPAAPSLGR